MDCFCPPLQSGKFYIGLAHQGFSLCSPKFWPGSVPLHPGAVIGLASAVGVSWFIDSLIVVDVVAPHCRLILCHRMIRLCFESGEKLGLVSVGSEVGAGPRSAKTARSQTMTNHTMGKPI